MMSRWSDSAERTLHHALGGADGESGELPSQVLDGRVTFTLDVGLGLRAFGGDLVLALAISSSRNRAATSRACAIICWPSSRAFLMSSCICSWLAAACSFALSAASRLSLIRAERSSMTLSSGL